MIAAARHLIVKIARRDMVSRTAALSTRVAQSYYETVDSQLDPLGLDIVNSPEVRQILAQQGNNNNNTSNIKKQQQSDPTLVRRKLFSSWTNDGYDSDCEPMHDNWETNDGSSIDEKRML